MLIFFLNVVVVTVRQEMSRSGQECLRLVSSKLTIFKVALEDIAYSLGYDGH